MKIALVYDRAVKFGGAERVVQSLGEVFPDAPLFTAFYDKKNAAWAHNFHVFTSFFDRFGSKINDSYKILPFLSPFAFENFDFDGFDIVVTVTSGDAKSIITKPHTLHICYCLTPTRYLWSATEEYMNEPGLGNLNSLARFSMKVFFPRLRKWDLITSKRPDKYISISQTVAGRIKKYYGFDSEIIYPPVFTNIFKMKAKIKSKEKFFLIVSRLVPYKRIDYAIKAFNESGLKLIIIGTGIDKERLKSFAKRNIHFISRRLTDEKLCWYYQNCQALVFPGEEDFGLTSLESQACGTPVIGYFSGGLKETVIPGVTGEVFDKPDPESLLRAIEKFNSWEYNKESCRKNALKYRKEIFQDKIRKYIKKAFKDFKKI